MKRVKVGLNGFGRIGRALTRIALSRDAFDIVLINTRKTDPEMLAYLLQYDSVYRKFAMKVEALQDGISVNGKKIPATQCDDPEKIPWDEYGAEIVIDATGAFTTKNTLSHHIHHDTHESPSGISTTGSEMKGHHLAQESVKKVVLTAPAKDDSIPHIVLGVNDDSFDFAGSEIVSNCSCTTNCAAPLFKVLDQNLKIVSGFLTTAHAYTQTQSLLDDSLKTPDRSRAAGLNIVPSTTGAATAVVKTLPNLSGKIDGMSIRVPVPIVSFTDISVVVEKETTVQEVNEMFKKAAEGPMKEILGYENQVLVSSDYIGSAYSSIFDANYTKVIGGNFVKVFGWYDNEWGYSSRLVDLVERLSSHV